MNRNTFCWDLDGFKALGTTTGYFNTTVTARDPSAHHVLFPFTSGYLEMKTDSKNDSKAGTRRNHS